MKRRQFWALVAPSVVVMFGFMLVPLYQTLRWSLKPSHGHDQTIVNGVSRIGYMTGGKAARWVDEDIADALTGQARIVHRAESSRTRSSCTSRLTTSTFRACRIRDSGRRRWGRAAMRSWSSTGAWARFWIRLTG